MNSSSPPSSRTFSRARCVPALLALLALVSLPVVADAAEAPTDDELHLNLTFGVWATSVDASMQVNNLSGDADVCFTDLLQSANYAFNPGAELTKGNWIFDFDMTISQLSDSQAGPLGLADVDVEATIGAWNFMVGYCLLRKELDNGMNLTLTLAAGALLTYSDTKVDPELLQSQQESVIFIDPVVGGRIVLGLTPQLNWRTEGTIGGFGVGSDLTWSAGSYLDWKFAEHFSLNIGYRALYWDYDLGTVNAEILLHGPWLGVTWNVF